MVSVKCIIFTEIILYIYIVPFWYFTSSVEFLRCMGKTIFFFNWSLFQSRSYNCTSIGSCRIKKCTAVVREPMAMQPAIARQNRRVVWLYNQLLCHRNSDFFSLVMKTLLRWRRDLPLKCLSSWIEPLAATSLQIWSSPAAIWWDLKEQI